MLGLVASVGGAVALEIRRIRKKGGPEEVKDLKARERELRELLEATNQELARAQKQNETAESKARELEQEKTALEQQAAELGRQKEQLQQNNSKLVLTNVLLLNKAKHLEDSSRALVAKQEDLQHQLEQLQRERQAQLEASEATLAALKEQVTTVLNRYLSKDIELQAALQEMQALGIELVPLDAQDGRPDNVMEFEPRFVLESPHRMQRLMHAAAGRTLHLHGQEQDVHMLLPMGIGKDPGSGMHHVALGWRHEPQATSITGVADAELQVPDQQAGSASTPTLSMLDKASAGCSSSEEFNAPEIVAADSGRQALTFSSASKKQQPSGTGFSFGFGGSFGRLSMRSSDGGSSKRSQGGSAAIKPPVVPSSLLKNDLPEDEPSTMISSSRALASTR